MERGDHIPLVELERPCTQVLSPGLFLLMMAGLIKCRESSGPQNVAQGDAGVKSLP
jgi:hypothetical protein